VEIVDEKLFAGFGSLVVEVTVAVLDAVVEELNVEAVVLMVMITRPPTLIVPILQLTVPPACEQVPWVEETETNVTWVGNGSETATPWATPGPLLETCRV